MKTTKIGQQHKNITKAGKRLDLSFKDVAHDMEDRLRKMGIQPTKGKPRICAHKKGGFYRRRKTTSTAHPSPKGHQVPQR